MGPGLAASPLVILETFADWWTAAISPSDPTLNPSLGGAHARSPGSPMVRVVAFDPVPPPSPFSTRRSLSPETSPLALSHCTGTWLCPTRREKKKTKLRVQSNPIVQLLVHDAVSDCPTSCCGQSHRSIRRKTSVYPSVPMPCHALRSRTGTRGSVGRSISSGQG